MMAIFFFQLLFAFGSYFLFMNRFFEPFRLKEMDERGRDYGE